MATTTTLSEQEYRELALSEPDRNWELWNGMPRAKPPMSMKHNAVSFLLRHFLQNQLERSVYRVNVNSDRARISSRAYYIPDVIVIPAAYQRVFEHDSRALGVYAKPLPFVAEVWSPSTGDYDITAKLPLYQGRGDLEIWFIHPSERTLTVWRKQPDGTYAEGHYTSGIVPVVSLPNVTIDFDALLDG